MMKKISYVLTGLFFSFSVSAQEWHVAKSGSDNNSGTKEEPWLTISFAAKKAQAGDEIIVHEGIYREQVNLEHGGISEDKRLVFRAASGEQVAIKGSEVINNWKIVKKNRKATIWQVELDASFFKALNPSGFNPYDTLVRYPKKVVIDTTFGESGWQTYGFKAHRGNIFMNNQPLKEVFKERHLKKSPLTWMVKQKGSKTYLLANFSDADPNQALTEITVREKLFAAKNSNVNYVTLQGFSLHHAATHWAPPTVYQPGAIEPNGSTHWIIDDNDIAYSRAVCISVGIPSTEGDFEELKGKGHHIISNNTIKGCGQAGIAGQAYADHSLISHNTIEEINQYEEFGGWETAAIKLHHNDYTVIENNFISDIYSKDVNIGSAHGIWIDFQNTQLVVQNNVVMNAEAYPIMLEANWDGPFLVANNIFVGSNFSYDLGVAIHSSLNAVWAHNLFIDTSTGWLNQTFDDRPPVAGGRWFNNIFVGDAGLSSASNSAKDMVFDHNLYLDGARPHNSEKHSLISKTKSNIQFDVEPNRIQLSFELAESDIGQSLKPVNQTLHQKNLQDVEHRDIPVLLDMQNRPRSTSPQWGPFENIQAGKNSFSIPITR